MSKEIDVTGNGNADGSIVSDAAVQYVPLPKPHSSPEEGKLYTYSDYMTWELDDGELYELIDGIACKMPAPSTGHQSISRELMWQLHSYLKGKTCKVFAAPYGVRLNMNGKDNTVVLPDLVVICDRDKIKPEGCIGAPDMAVEILSPSTAQHDRLRKMRLYEKAGVCEFWLVDPEIKVVHVHILKDRQYCIMPYGDDDKVSVGILEDCVIDLAEVFEM